jgi:hypothetical protein
MMREMQRRHIGGLLAALSVLILAGCKTGKARACSDALPAMIAESAATHDYAMARTGELTRTEYRTALSSVREKVDATGSKDPSVAAGLADYSHAMAGQIRFLASLSEADSLADATSALSSAADASVQLGDARSALIGLCKETWSEGERASLFRALVGRK